MKSRRLTFFLAMTLFPALASAGAEGPLSLDVIKVNSKGSWTEVQIAIQNNGDTDAQFECCTVFLENSDGYAVASLNQGEVRSQIHNKAKTGAILGGIAAGGLGLGGLISGHEELGYAAVGVGAGSAIAGTVGEAGAEGAARDIVIDDIMRNHLFPAGLKVAGIAYFPPKKKWPGSKRAEEIHLTYKMGNQTYRASSPVPN
ncbi:MAG TPA: hypothetical protein VLJ37_11080 [bacterium]|nr:hypothetical protein [bacterium]